MRKADLITASRQVSEALRGSGLERPLVELARLGYRSRPVPGELLTRLLTALRDYALQADRFPRPARELVKSLGLEALERPETWSSLIAPDAPPKLAFSFAERLRFASVQLPRVAGLLDRSGIPAIDAARRGEGTGALMTVQVIEAPRRFSTPTRLATLLESLDLLYGACATLEGEAPNGLSVIACDSGSDKTFELMGTPVVIAALREHLLTVWDRVVFHRDLPVPDRYRRTVEDLPMTQRIRAAEAAGRVSPEEGELLRRRITDGTIRFLAAGATLPELRERSHANPRVLLAPAPRLLAPPVG
jgi:hypothetical protein